jgi:fucose permease
MIWPFVLISYFSLMALGLADNIRGPLFPEMLRVFAVSDALGAWIFALSSLCGIGGSLSSGWFFRRWDRVKALRFSLVLLSISLIGLGASPNFAVLLFFTCGLGFSFGLMGVCQNVLATLGASGHRRRQVLSGLHSMYGLASFMAPLLVAFAVPAFDSWRAPLFLAALAPLFVLFYAHHRIPHETHEYRASEAAAKSQAKPFRRWGAVWLASALACYVLCEILISSRLALYLRREAGADLSSSSFAVTGFFLFLLAGRFVAAVLHIPVRLKTQAVLSLLCSLALLCWGLTGQMEAFVLCGLSMAVIYPVLVGLLAEEFPHHLNAVMGILLALQSAFVVVMHLSVGWMTDEFGIRAAFLIGPAALLVSIFLVLSYGPLFRRHTAGL